MFDRNDHLRWLTALLVVLVAITALALAAGPSANASGSEHDIDVTFSDETTRPGEQVTALTVADPASDPGADVESSDVDVQYDESNDEA